MKVRANFKKMRMKFGSREDYKFSLEMDVICNNNEEDGSKTRLRVGW